MRKNPNFSFAFRKFVRASVCRLSFKGKRKVRTTWGNTPPNWWVPLKSGNR